MREAEALTAAATATVAARVSLDAAATDVAAHDEALKALEGRVFGVHLKDVRDATRFTILGQGNLDVVGILKELNRQRYGGILSLEYEESPQDPLPDIRKCLEVVQSAISRT